MRIIKVHVINASYIAVGKENKRPLSLVISDPMSLFVIKYLAIQHVGIPKEQHPWYTIRILNKRKKPVKNRINNGFYVIIEDNQRTIRLVRNFLGW